MSDERGDFTTDTGCTIRLRVPAHDFTKVLLMYDMGHDDGRYAEVMLTPSEAHRLSRELSAFADRIDP